MLIEKTGGKMPLTRLCLQNAANKIMSSLIPNSGNTGKYWQNADILLQDH